MNDLVWATFAALPRLKMTKRRYEPSLARKESGVVDTISVWVTELVQHGPDEALYGRFPLP